MVWTPLWREKGRLRPTALVPTQPALSHLQAFAWAAPAAWDASPTDSGLARSPQLCGATSWLVSWQRLPARLPGVWTSASPCRALRATERTLAFHVREVGALGSLGLGKAVNGLWGRERCFQQALPISEMHPAALKC